MGLWFVSPETFPGSAQWTGLCVWWLEASRKLGPQPRELVVGVWPKQVTEFRRRLKQLVGFLGPQGKQASQRY